MSTIPYPHIIPNIEDWPISKFANNRNQFISKLLDYTFNSIVNGKKYNIEEVLSKTIYLEKLRCKNNPWKVDPKDEQSFWKGLSGEFDKAVASDQKKEDLEKILKRIINRYSEEITGGFTPSTFRKARRVLTSIFKRFFNKAFSKNQRFFWGKKKNLLDKIKVYGYVEELRELFDKGTVVIVPTHFSNIDSQIIGYVLDQVIGVPAFLYGAGLNLFDYEILAYYMNNLGTYRVDRRKKNPIYLETLKSMTSLSLIEGVNNIFFPGGTRSRNGKIENKLKLGLLNSAIEAQLHSYQNGVNKKIFIVPMIMSYPFVFEAKSLIKQHLRKDGADRYQRSSSKISMFTHVRHFHWVMFKKSSEMHISFGQAMDVLGNYVNGEGESIDNKDQVIQINEYFVNDDGLSKDTQRESIYTKILAEKITTNYLKENRILASEVLAYTFFKLLTLQYPGQDIYDVFRVPVKNFTVDKSKLIEAVDSFVLYLREKEQKEILKLSEIFHREGITGEEIVNDGLYHLGIYHPRKAIKYYKKNILCSEDFQLLYYYHNKIDGYGFDYNFKKTKVDTQRNNLIVTA